MAHRPRTGVSAAAQSILTDDPDFLRFLVERVVQAVLEAEMTARLHAEPYERNPERRGYRNGYKPRLLNTRVGTLTLQVRRKLAEMPRALSSGSGQDGRSGTTRGTGRRAPSGQHARNLRGNNARASDDNSSGSGGTLGTFPPGGCGLLEEGIEDCLACLAFPFAHRPRIRTTNGLERLHEEIKRRTRVVPGALRADSRIPPPAIRLVTALCVEQSEKWVSGRRYLEMGEMAPSLL